MKLPKDLTQRRNDANLRKVIRPFFFALLGVLCVFASSFGFSVRAQEATPEQRPVTDDEVNAIAGRMYCPVCEFVPLDTCGEPACIVWRSEIRAQLATGRTEDQIIADFVARYGDRVVGVPQNSVLRALSLVAPFALTIIALGIGFFTFARWRRPNAPTGHIESRQEAPPGETLEADYYRSRLDEDLRK